MGCAVNSMSNMHLGSQKKKKKKKKKIFEIGHSFGQFVVRFIKFHLITLDFLAQISNVGIVFIRKCVCFFGISLKPCDGSIEQVGFALQRSHLLSDSIHFSAVVYPLR